MKVIVIRGEQEYSNHLKPLNPKKKIRTQLAMFELGSSG